MPGECPPSESEKAVLGHRDPGAGREVVEDDLAGPDVVPIHPRGELGDPQDAILAGERGLGPRAAERAPA